MLLPTDHSDAIGHISAYKHAEIHIYSLLLSWITPFRPDGMIRVFQESSTNLANTKFYCRPTLHVGKQLIKIPVHGHLDIGNLQSLEGEWNVSIAIPKQSDPWRPIRLQDA